MPKSLIIPTGIPSYHRLRTNAGPGSFCAIYDVEDPVTLDIRRHALFIAATSTLTLVIDGNPITLPAGSAILAGYQKVEISGPGELHLFVFGHNAVRHALGRLRLIETIISTACAEEFPPTPVHDFYPHVACQVSAGPENYTEHLTEILQVLMLDRVPASAYSYFRRTFYRPRLGMCLELERQIFDPRSIDKAFKTEFRKYHGCTTDAWLEQRRAELAMHWLRHGMREVDDIAGALQFSEKEFRQTFEQHRNMRPHDVVRSRDRERISPTALSKIIRPAWLPPLPQWTKQAPSEFDEIDDGTDELRFMSKVTTPAIDPSAIADFWELKSTGIDIVQLPEFLRSSEQPVACAA